MKRGIPPGLRLKESEIPYFVRNDNLKDIVAQMVRNYGFTGAGEAGADPAGLLGAALVRPDDGAGGGAAAEAAGATGPDAGAGAGEGTANSPERSTCPAKVSASCP